MFPLRELATTRIVEWAKSNWTSGNFPDVVQEIWRSTPPHENNLRDEIVEIVSTHVQYLLTQDSLNDVLIDNPEFAVAVLKRVVKELTNPRSLRVMHFSSTQSHRGNPVSDLCTHPWIQPTLAEANLGGP